MFDSFRAYLADTVHAKEKYIPYYLKWVSDGYHFLKAETSTSLDDTDREAYLRHLAKSHEDWQVNQADYALRLYT